MTVFLLFSLAWPVDTPSFISKVEPQSRMYVMDKDLVTLEGQARGAVISALELGRSRYSGTERSAGHARQGSILYPLVVGV